MKIINEQNLNEVFGTYSIPYGDRGKKLKIRKGHPEDVKVALERITMNVPKPINGKHVQDAKIRMDWGIKFIKELYKMHILNDYDYKVVYNNLCKKVAGNTELARIYEPFRIKMNQDSTRASIGEASDRKKKHAQGWFTTLGGDPEVNMKAFNHALGNDHTYSSDFSAGDDSVAQGEIAATGAAATGASAGGGMGESLTEADERTQIIKQLRDLDVPYNFDKFPTDRLKAILMKELGKQGKKNNTKKGNAKYIIDDKGKNDFRWYKEFDGRDIYEHKDGYFKIDGVDRTFPTCQDAEDYLQGIGEY